MSVKITGVTARDIRFPTSKNLDGSDAMNKDPDYSAAYVTLHTDQKGLEGDGLTFTIGRGNEVCVAAINSLAPLLIGHELSEFTKDMGAFWYYITHDSQIRWIGPEKGAIHMATGAIVNAVWDLWAKVEGKPVWELVVDMSPEELVCCINFTYITDVLTKDEALMMLKKQEPNKLKRKQEMLDHGYPAYTTSAGWLGYSDEKLQRLCQEAIDAGWNHIKIKVGGNLQDDIRRCGLVRKIIGPKRKLMVDANQRWDVGQAIEWMKALHGFDIWFIEEPTSPDDILGHKKIRDAIKPIGVATGEQCQNRIIFKQFLEAGSIDVCQIDSCRLGGVNEVLAVLLMAAKFNTPVCPHAGGVGLCEYVQHLSMIDYICISGSTENRVLEYVDHLHEHFVDPVTMKSGHYMAPKKPGYSITMYPASLDAFEFPNGKEWR
ncbi:MAG: fuconate dehydratase [Gammaproteobacteria bacterium RIFCSPHIGHO2_12_FULL_37_14]|nr:MAG: fuconate dehydratase [Gammaproteobacteria bacterium RIFCSPHIGHO2_12_FULL_37_14]